MAKGIESMEEKDKKDLFTRRRFIEKIGNGALTMSVLGSGVFIVQYLSPNVLLEPSSSFKVGLPIDYPQGSVTLLPSKKVYIIRDKSGYFYALSATCTHLGCITSWKGEEGVIACPCHGSRFDLTGQKIAGPAPRPLPRIKMDLNDKGELVVDKSIVVSEETVLKV
jgi:cytochrome b6-f complex iron-sulfur subunit